MSARPRPPSAELGQPLANPPVFFRSRRGRRPGGLLGFGCPGRTPGVHAAVFLLRSVGDHRTTYGLLWFGRPGRARRVPAACAACMLRARTSVGTDRGTCTWYRFPDRAALAKDYRCSFRRLKVGRRFQDKQGQSAMHGSAGASPSRLFTIPSFHHPRLSRLASTWVGGFKSTLAASLLRARTSVGDHRTTDFVELRFHSSSRSPINRVVAPCTNR